MGNSNGNNQFDGYKGINSAPSNQMSVEAPPSSTSSGGGFFSDALESLTNAVSSLFTAPATDGQDWYKVFPYQIVAVRYKKPENPPILDNILGAASSFPSFIEDSSSLSGLAGDAAGLLGNSSPAGPLAPIESVLGPLPVEETHLPIDKCFVYTLPIPPESLAINMISASEATATLDGVVEETSASVFWDIQVSGTTGIAVGYQDKSDSRGMADQFRTTLSSTGLLIGATSALAKAAGGIGAIIDAGVDAASSIGSSDSVLGGVSNIFGGLAGVLGAATLPKLPYGGSGVNGSSNGFTTIKDLHDIFYTYANNKEQEPDMYDLFFVNQKDDQVYQIVLKGGIQVQKSVRDPYLYRYAFALKGWERTTLIDSVFQLTNHPINRYKTDLKTVNTFNLPQLQNTMSNIGANAISSPLKAFNL